MVMGITEMNFRDVYEVLYILRALVKCITWYLGAVEVWAVHDGATNDINYLGLLFRSC